MIISELTLRSIVRRSILQQTLTETDLSYSGILGDKFQTLSGAVTDASKAKQLGQDLSNDINNFIKKASSIKSVQDFLTSKTESLRAIELENKKYIAYGYYTVDDKECVVIQVQKKNHQDMMKKGAKLLEAGKSYNIKNHGSSSNITLKKNEKNAYYALPVKTPGIKFTADKLESGGNSPADWSVEFLSILGGIPIAGLGFDAAAATIALMKDPPDYIIAAFCLLFALPIEAITLLYGFRKQAELAMKASTASMEQQTKILAKMIADEAKRLDLGENIMRNIVATGRETGEAVIRELKEPAVLGRLAKVSGKSTQQLASNVDEFSDVWKKLLDNMTDEGAEAGGKAVSKEAREKISKVVTEQGTQVLNSLKQGSLRNLIKKSSTNLRDSVASKYKRSFQLAFSDAVADVREREAKAGVKFDKNTFDFEVSMEIFSTYADDIVGKKIPLPDPPGGNFLFENFDAFSGRILEISQMYGYSFNDAVTESMFRMYKFTKSDDAYRTISDENLQAITDTVIDKFSNMTIRLTNDVKASSAHLSLRSKSVMGYANPSTGEIVFNVEGMGKYVDSDELLESIIQEEITHAIDGYILSAVVAGDEFIENLVSKGTVNKLTRNDMTASDRLARRVFKTSAANKTFATRVGLSTSYKDLLKGLVDELGEDFTGKQFINFLSNAGNNKQQRVKYLMDNFNIPEFHCHYIVDYFLGYHKLWSKKPGEAVTSEISRSVTYLGNPPEFLVRARYIAQRMEKAGLDISSKDDIVKFFKSSKSYEEFTSKLDHFSISDSLFKFVYEAVTETGNESLDVVIDVLQGFN